LCQTSEWLIEPEQAQFLLHEMTWEISTPSHFMRVSEIKLVSNQ